MDTFDERTVGSLVTQILSVLNVVHSLDLVYCAIDLDHISCKQEKPTFENANFKFNGYSSVIKLPVTNKKNLPKSDKRRFFSPEICEGNLDQIGCNSDIWSLGVLVYYLCSQGNYPYQAQFDKDTDLSQLKEIDWLVTKGPENEYFSPGVKDFLKVCMKLDPKERWSSKELQGHFWVQDLEKEREKHLKDVQVLKNNFVTQMVMNHEWLQHASQYEWALFRAMGAYSIFEEEEHMQDYIFKAIDIFNEDGKISL